MVYDYRLDDAGVSRPDDDEEDEERKVNNTLFYIDFFIKTGTIRSEQNRSIFLHLIIDSLLVLQVQWVSWMESAKNIVITPDTNYADIIVPTADTIRMSFLMDKLLTNKKPVSALTDESCTSVCKRLT